MTYAALDDQSTDVFVTDSLLDVSEQEVNVPVSTIVGITLFGCEQFQACKSKM